MNRPIPTFTIWLTLVVLSNLNPQLSAFSQGSLTPPGAPGPTMKTLDQLDAKLTQISGRLEPRTPISSLPFTITASGSYYLTTNLAGPSGITIFTNGVTLDLMGFELIGFGGSGSGKIVPVGAGQRTNLVVRNGTVRNWAAPGVAAGAAWNSLFENLRLSHNGSIGLSAGPGSIIRNCVAMNNALKGFEADRDSLITDCVARNNGNNGIEAPHGSIVSSCIVVSNGLHGISVSDACLITSCIAISNRLDGIQAGVGGKIKDCLVRQNYDDGIQVISDALVTDNVCTGNGWGSPTGAGVHASGAGNSIEANLVILNDRGFWVEQTGNVIIRNKARANGSNYGDIAGGNVTGPLVTSGTVGTSANPHANYDC